MTLFVNHFFIKLTSISPDFQVLVPKRLEFKGKMIEVDIYEAGKHFMKGKPVEGSKPFTPSIAAPLQKGQVSGLMQVISLTHADTWNNFFHRHPRNNDHDAREKCSTEASSHSES